jgi:hypothetical protein
MMGDMLIGVGRWMLSRRISGVYRKSSSRKSQRSSSWMGKNTRKGSVWLMLGLRRDHGSRRKGSIDILLSFQGQVDDILIRPTANSSC